MKTGDKLIDATIDGVKDVMWSMFWAGKQQANLPYLEECVMRLIRATTQKVGSSYEKMHGGLKPTTVDWNTLDVDLLMIAMEATALVLDPRFQVLKDAWETDKTAAQLLDDYNEESE